MKKRLLRNVRPVSAGRDDAAVDILIDSLGVIEAVSPTPMREAAGGDVEVVDLRGAYVSRGWVDLHTHIYYGATDISIRPSQCGMVRGVTTLVDAGSSGEANFEGFREYIAGGAAESIYAFLNIGSIGLTACNRVSELRGIEDIDVDRVLATAESHPDLIRGIKVRASHVILGGWGMTPVRVAKKVARILRRPLMVHIGESPPTLDEVLASLDPGDIVTHCFNGKRGGNILDDETILGSVRKALSNGILFDIGHGGASFSFDVGKRAFDLGILPFSISTDLHQHSIHGPVFDLPTTMSKMMAIGLSLQQVIECVTDHPATALGLKEPPGDFLETGQGADLTVFEVEEFDGDAVDSQGARLKIPRMISPRLAVRGSLAVKASRNSPAD
ncbi:MAG TPA: amidohydrolase/deacetylase family metallohydrolase [Spirochaetia bacterium]|nr:amidohydrolase/deacetylase family metallohydrolase [Spirochaetia bacterium]